MGLMDFFRKGVEKPVEQKPKVSAPVTPNPPVLSVREYTIKSGDTLSKIAQQYYGNASDWKKIHEANKNLIKDPNKIFPGQKIIIP